MLRDAIRLTTLSPFMKYSESPEYIATIGPVARSMTTRSLPGNMAASRHVSMTIVSAGVRSVVFCEKVSVWYHVAA